MRAEHHDAVVQGHFVQIGERWRVGGSSVRVQGGSGPSVERRNDGWRRKAERRLAKEGGTADGEGRRLRIFIGDGCRVAPPRPACLVCPLSDDFVACQVVHGRC